MRSKTPAAMAPEAAAKMGVIGSRQTNSARIAPMNGAVE